MLKIQITLFITLMLNGATSYAANSSSNSGGSKGGSVSFSDVNIMIPVRLSVGGGYHASSAGFDNDLRNYSMSGWAASGDFNVPLKPLRLLIGATGWIAFPQSRATGETDTFVILGPYLGFLGESTEAFLGVGAGFLKHTTPGATPKAKTELSISMGCGLAGARKYFGNGAALGFGVTGYYCKASSYTKDDYDMNGILTNSHVVAEAGSSGAMTYLFLSWGEERKLK